MSNISTKVVYMAFDQRHEHIFPNSYTIQELNNYMRCICNTFIIVEMSPTTKQPTI